MSQLSQAGDDLRVVRAAVDRQETARRGKGSVYFVWAAYVLIGYILIDVKPAWVSWYFILAWFPAGAASGFLSSRFHDAGERNRRLGWQKVKHWIIGAILAVGAPIGLRLVGAIRGESVGQVCVILFGMLYFFEGIYGDPTFLWLGPVLVVGGILVSLVPHYPWTALGAVIAFGLCAAGVISMKRISKSTIAAGTRAQDAQ